MHQSLNNFLFYLKSFLPRSTPIDLPTVEVWLKDALRLAGLKDTPKNREVGAQFLYRIPPGHKPSVRFIAKHLRWAAKAQVATQVIKDAQSGPKLQVAPE
jgi:hypothetical protein